MSEMDPSALVIEEEHKSVHAEESDWIIKVELSEERLPPPIHHPAGKSVLRALIVKLMPEHNTYCEPFCGMAGVFFAKPRSTKEILNDLDPNCFEILKFLQTASEDDWNKIKEMNWQVSRTHFDELQDSKPESKAGRIYRLLYLMRFSFHGEINGSFTPSQGVRGFPESLWKRREAYKERLRGVTILNEDFEKVMRKYDSANTVFFLDPPYMVSLGSGEQPYPGGSAEESKIIFKRLTDLLPSIKVKWILTHVENSEARSVLEKIGNLRTVTVAEPTSRAGATGSRREMIAANFKLPERLRMVYMAKGILDAELIFEDESPTLEKAMPEFVGLYLVEPHPRWMWTGEKKAIVKSIKLEAHINESVYLLGEYVYGVIKLKAPEEIDLKQFEKLRDLHRISDAERKKWWPGAEKLYLYRYEWVEKFDPPHEYEFQPGAQIFVSHVAFKADVKKVQLHFLGTRGEIESKTLRHQKHSSLLLVADSSKLLIDFGEDHKGTLARIKPNWVLLTHAHPDHAFGLKEGTEIPVWMSDDSAKVLADLPIKNKQIFRDKESFKLGPFNVAAYPVVHSTKAPAHGFRIEVSDHTIAYFPDQLEIKDETEALSGLDVYIGDGAHVTRDIKRFAGGKPIGHASMMKQTKMAQQHGAEQIIFTHLGEQPLSEGKELDEIVENFGAKVAYDDMALTLDGEGIEKAYLTRGKPAYRIFELKDLDEIDTFQDPDREIEISVKWDGERLQAEKTDGKVTVYSDTPRDISDRLPIQIKEIESIEGDFTLDGEAVMLDVEKKEALHRTMVVGFLNAKGDPEPACKILHLMVFDVLRYQGEDLRNQPLEKRQKALAEFKDTEHVHFILPERDHEKEALAYIVKRSDPDFETLVRKLVEH